MNVRASFVRESSFVRLLVFVSVFALEVVLPRGGVAFALDANTATIEQLQTIRGIGPSTATRIVEARSGEPFRDLDDLRERVRGIGPKNLARMRDAGLEVGGGARLVQVGSGSIQAGAERSSSSARSTRRDAPVKMHVGRPR